LLTNRKERIFNPNFGAGLRALIFTQMTQSSLEEIKQSIINKLESYFPTLNILEFTINGNPEFNQISIYFKYNIKNTGQDDTVSVIIQSA
jgi:phage baseplate assembly protein W